MSFPFPNPFLKPGFKEGELARHTSQTAVKDIYTRVM